jgi:hypothetical protein
MQKREQEVTASGINISRFENRMIVEVQGRLELKFVFS